MQNITGLLNGVQSVAVVCNQWGDTGKGKFSDIVSEWADVIARGTGGANAGHTVVVGDQKRVFHLIPAGIIYDSQGKINMLGNGMVIDLNCLCDELNTLDREKLSYNNLMISEDAHVTLPHHLIRDKSNSTQKDGGIGSTGRGIGPTYMDKIGRKGIVVRDLFNQDTLVCKLNKLSKEYPELDFNNDDIISSLRPYADRIKPFVRDTVYEMHNFMRQGKKIALEGAQGLLLSIELGTYPYVTASDCSINGTATGVGLSAKMIDKVFGIVKFPFMTRVGAGPFPTEFGGSVSENYCAAGLEHDVKFELSKFSIPFESRGSGVPKYDHKHKNIIELINSSDPFEKSVGIRLAGEEYGATTGRPRRTGWTDLVALKYSVGVNGADIILTKVDVLEGASEIKLANSYEINGTLSDRFSRDSDILKKCIPLYRSFNGFNEKLSDIKSYARLPPGLRESIAYTERFTGGRVQIVSTGPDRNEYILK